MRLPRFLRVNKGRIQTSHYEQDDEVKYVTEVIAEKVTFLSTRRPEADK